MRLTKRVGNFGIPQLIAERNSNAVVELGIFLGCRVEEREQRQHIVDGRMLRKRLGGSAADKRIGARQCGTHHFEMPRLPVGRFAESLSRT